MLIEELREHLEPQAPPRAGGAPAKRSGEWSLLIAACRADVAGLADEVSRVFPDRRVADWSGVLALMDAQGVGPLGASTLLTLDPDLIPAPVRQALEERVQVGSLRAKVLVPELLGILDAFSAAGIEAIAYKGPALSAVAYGRAGLRDSIDLDLVVRERDVAAAHDVLRALGYRRQSPPALRPGVEAAWRAAANAAEFVSADRWLFVDLHWRVHQPRFPFRIGPDRLWSRPAHATLGGRAVRVFPPETLVALLCLHGAKDRWKRLIWVCDVDRLIRASPALDWDEVLGFAEESRCRRILGLGLLLARRLFDTPLPTRVLGRLAADSRLERLAATVEDRLLAGGITRPWWLEHFNLWPFHLQVFDTWSDAARYVGRTLVTPDSGDWALLRARLPDSLLPLRFRVRPLRQLASLARLSVRRGRRQPQR